MGPGAIKLMRAIKRRHPDYEAGMLIDPYNVAYYASDAELDSDHPGYHLTLDELIRSGVLRHAVEVEARLWQVQGLNPQYEITPEGERRMVRAFES